MIYNAELAHILTLHLLGSLYKLYDTGKSNRLFVLMSSPSSMISFSIQDPQLKNTFWCVSQCTSVLFFVFILFSFNC